MKIPKIKRPSKEVLAKIHALDEHKGMLAMIEPDSGNYFLGVTSLEAFKKAKKQYPDKILYLIRIGSPAAHKYPGVIKPTWK